MGHPSVLVGALSKTSVETEHIPSLRYSPTRIVLGAPELRLQTQTHLDPTQ